MGLASPVESLPVNGAEVGVTDDEVLDAAASRDMDFKLRSTCGIMSSIIRDRTKSVPTGTALVFLLRVRLAAVLYRFRWVLTCRPKLGQTLRPNCRRREGRAQPTALLIDTDFIMAGLAYVQHSASENCLQRAVFAAYAHR